MIDVRLTHDPIEYAPFDPPPQPGGGECVFLGRTRCEHDPAPSGRGDLVSLTYEAYRPMAEQVLEAIGRRAAEAHDCVAVRVIHRLGSVRLGEASVLVQVVSAHRGEAFTACRAIIDQLKTEAPIWKREEWSGGSARWSAGTPVP